VPSNYWLNDRAVMMKCETGKSNDIRTLLVLRLGALAYLKRRLRQCVPANGCKAFSRTYPATDAPRVWPSLVAERK
jgi:hypothetical protein